MINYNLENTCYKANSPHQGPDTKLLKQKQTEQNKTKQNTTHKTQNKTQHNTKQN